MWRHFRGDFLIYAASKVLVGISSFIVLRLLTGAMQPDEYGTYALIFAVVSITTTIATSYLTNAVIRYLPSAVERRRGRAFDKALLEISTPTVFASLALTGMVVAVFSISNIIPLNLPIVAASLVTATAASAFQIYSIYCYSDRQRVRYATMIIAQMTIFMAGALLIGWIPFDPVATALSMLGLSYILPLLLFRVPAPRWSLLPTDRSWLVLKQFFRYGAPLIALNIAIQLNTYLDQFMLRSMRGLADVGLYAANYVVADKVIYALSSVVSITIAPLIFREWERGNREASLQIVCKALMVFLAFGLPTFAFVVVFVEPIMSSLTGPEYAAGRAIVPFVLAGALFSGMAAIVAYIHTLVERTIELAAIYFVGIVCSFGANLLFIPQFGLMGSAYSTLLTYMVVFTILLVRAQMLCGVLRQMRPALASLVRRRP